LTQRLDIIDAQNNEKIKKEEETKDEGPKLTQKELLALAKKRRGVGGRGAGAGGKKTAELTVPLVDDDDLSLASAILDDVSVTSGDSSKMREKLLAQIEEANRLQTEQGWERTKERVSETLRRRWWNALTDHERFIFTHKKLTRRQNITKACRRKLSIKAAMLNWWSSRFVGIFVCHILKVFEERDKLLVKFKGSSFLVGGGHRVIEEKVDEQLFSDDEQSLASSVFSKKSAASSSVASSVMSKSRVSMVGLEQGVLDGLLDFEFAIPLYEGYQKLMNVKNGIYFPVGMEDPRIKERQKEKEEMERKKAAGLLMEDGTESQQQMGKRKGLAAKMLWKGAGAKVKLAVALSSEVRQVDQGENRIENSAEAEEYKLARAIEDEELRAKAMQVAFQLLGGSYAESTKEAIKFFALGGRKWRKIMEEADEDAEAIMERMREQSLLTDVSEQVLIKNNTVAKQLLKVEILDELFERAVRTAEMPRCPGWDDETKWPNLNKMSSISQLKETAVDEAGNMIFKKLEMSNMKTTMAFMFQRAYVKLQEIAWEGRYNAAALIQGRIRGSIVRRIMKKIQEQARGKSENILRGEMMKRMRAREEEIKRMVEAGMVLQVTVQGEGEGESVGQGLLVRLPSVLLELGRSKKVRPSVERRQRAA